MNYFAYGSNMFTFRLEKRVGRVDVLGIGILAHYKLQFNKKSNDGSLKANALFTGKEEDEVIGVIFKINPNKREELDKAEGLGKGYDLKEVKIELNDTKEHVTAFTYISHQTDDTIENRPYDWYMELIKKGAEEHNLPKAYREIINSIPFKEDEKIIRKDSNLYLIKESKLIKKNLTNSFEVIFELNKPKEFEINIPSHALNNRKLVIEKSHDGFKFQTDSTIPKGIQRHKELQVSDKKILLRENGKDSKLFIEGNHFLLNTISYDFENKLKLLKGKINSIGNSSVDDFNNKYLRLIIPSERKLRIINDYLCKGFLVDYKSKIGLLELKLNDKTFHLYEINFGENSYVLIDCIERSSFLNFQNCCQAILLTYAFLSGDYHSNEGYFLGFEDNLFDMPPQILYHTFSKSKYDINSAFTTNFYIGIDLENIQRDEKGFIDEETRKEKYKDIMLFHPNIFSNICQIALDNEKVFRSLILLIENQSSTLEMKIPIQYVAIEALTGVIIKNGNSELKPIEDNDLANELISELKIETENFLKKHNIQIEGNDLIPPLFKKLDSLNSPTNADKLTKPFLEVGYRISDEEKKIIKLRDTFLHGSIKNFGSLDDDFKGLFYISLKLHFLISVLLLKKTGFEGRIINYPKLYEYITEKYLDEDVLRKI